MHLQNILIASGRRWERGKGAKKKLFLKSEKTGQLLQIPRYLTGTNLTI